MIVYFKALGVVNAEPLLKIDWSGRFTSLMVPNVGHFVEIPPELEPPRKDSIRWWEVRRVDHSFAVGAPIVTVWVSPAAEFMQTMISSSS